MGFSRIPAPASWWRTAIPVQELCFGPSPTPFGGRERPMEGGWSESHVATVKAEKSIEIWWSFRERIRLSTLCVLMFIVSIAMISYIYIHTSRSLSFIFMSQDPGKSGTPMIHWLILVPPSMVVLAVRLEFSIRESRNGWQIEMDQLEVCLEV